MGRYRRRIFWFRNLRQWLGTRGLIQSGYLIHKSLRGFSIFERTKNGTLRLEKILKAHNLRNRMLNLADSNNVCYLERNNKL